MEFTTANPFVPKASVVRYPNSVFEARIHLPGAAANIDVVPHENFILVTGSLAPRVRVDAESKPSTLVFTDQACGVFGRDIPVNLTTGTELIVLSAHQDCDDYVVRYTIRNSISPRANCADIANATAGVAGATGCNSSMGMKLPCGIANAGMPIGHSFVRPGSCTMAPAVLGRGPGMHGGIGYGHGYAGYEGYAGHNHGFAHPAGVVNGAGIIRSSNVAQTGASQVTFHRNGGATI